MSKMFSWSKYTFYHLFFTINYDEYKNRSVFCLCIGIYKLFISIPLYSYKSKEYENPMDYPRLGFVYSGMLLVYYWKDYKGFFMPWEYELVKHDILYPGGEVYMSSDCTKNSKRTSWYELEHKDHLVKTINLEHKLKDGTLQNVKVKLRGEEMFFKMRMLKWLPFHRSSRYVDFEFSEEVGEGTGSYKGGLLQTSAELKLGESLEKAFYRWYFKWNGK